MKDLERILSFTPYAESAACIKLAFDNAGARTFEAIENLPSKFGAKVCGCDIYSVIAAIGDIIKSGSLGDELNLPISDKQRASLAAAGLRTEDEILEAGLDGLVEINHIGQGTAKKIIAAVQGDEQDDRTN